MEVVDLSDVSDGMEAVDLSDLSDGTEVFDVSEVSDGMAGVDRRHECLAEPSLKPIGYTWSYLAWRIGHCVPILQPYTGSSFQLLERVLAPRHASVQPGLPACMQNRTLRPYLAAIHRSAREFGSIASGSTASCCIYAPRSVCLSAHMLQGHPSSQGKIQ
jgi:hypothetical protein